MIIKIYRTQAVCFKHAMVYVNSVQIINFKDDAIFGFGWPLCAFTNYIYLPTYLRYKHTTSLKVDAMLSYAVTHNTDSQRYLQMPF